MADRVDHIQERNGKYVLLSKKTGDVLGTHATREGAEAQERAIEANKHADEHPEQGPSIGAPLTDPKVREKGQEIAPMPDGVSAYEVPGKPNDHDNDYDSKQPNMQAGWNGYGAHKQDCQRIDVFHLDGSAIERTPQGGIKVPAYLTRTGVFEYRTADGAVRREYRPPNEVFDAGSLKTLEDAPVTDLHQGMVRADSYQTLAKGHVRDVKKSGNFVAANVLVQDAALVQAVERGDRREISCGYECSLEMTPGRTDSGQEYDAVQMNIKYNHAALLPVGAGRAGREVGLRLDGAAFACHTYEMRIRFDGKDYDLSVPAEKEAFEKACKALESARTDGATALATVTAEKDQAIKDRDAARADAADARDPVKMAARVEKRSKLEGKAREILGQDVKFDGLTNSQLREKVVLHSDSSVQERLDEYKDEKGEPTAGRKAYVKARFDALFASNSVASARAALVVSTLPGGGQSMTAIPQAEAWKSDLTVSKGKK
jgi:uncharacterized protein